MGPAQRAPLPVQWTFPSSTRAGIRASCGSPATASSDRWTRAELGDRDRDLTRNDHQARVLRRPITRTITGAEVYCTIFALVESPHERDVLWAGTDGRPRAPLARPRSLLAAGDPAGPAEWALISVLDPHPMTPPPAISRATATSTTHTRPLSLKTSDYGRTWNRSGETCRPASHPGDQRGPEPARAALLRHRDRRVGVPDDGGAWARLRGNLPVAPIHDLIVKDGGPRGGHARALLLDPRRSVTPAPDGGRGPRSGAHLFTPGGACVADVRGTA